MEIPQIKKLYASNGETLNVVSISVDKNRNAWKKAMEKEQNALETVSVTAGRKLCGAG
jgi:hypothetical protein